MADGRSAWGGFFHGGGAVWRLGVVMWTQARITLYIAAALGALASLAAVFQLGTYDAETGMFDLHAFDVKWLATQVALWVAPVIAGIAAKLGWGR